MRRLAQITVVILIAACGLVIADEPASSDNPSGADGTSTSWLHRAFAEVEIHGFASQGYVDSSENNIFFDTESGSSEYSEYGINFISQLTDELRIGIQLFARDYGQLGNNEVKVDWVFADYRPEDWLGLRFGLMKAPHGLYNETRDVDSVRPWIFLPQSVYQETLRDAMLSLQGGGLYGNVEMGAFGMLSYTGMFGTQNIDPDKRLTEGLLGLYTTMVKTNSIDVDYRLVGCLRWDTPLQGLRLSATLNRMKMAFDQEYLVEIPGTPIVPGTPSPVNYPKRQDVVYSAQYARGNLLLVAEYIDTTREIGIEFLGVLMKTQPYGWYTGGAFRLNRWFQVGAYYSETNDDRHPLVPEQPAEYYDYLKDACLTLRFDINRHWIAKVEYHDYEGAYGFSAWDNQRSDPGWNDSADFAKDWGALAAKMAVEF